MATPPKPADEPVPAAAPKAPSAKATTPNGLPVKAPTGKAFVKALNATYAHPTLPGLRFPQGQVVRVVDLGSDPWLLMQLDAGFFAEIAQEDAAP